MEMKITHEDVFNYIRNAKVKFVSAAAKQSIYLWVKQKYVEAGAVEFDENWETAVRTAISAVCCHLSQRWENVKRKESSFKDKYAEWLKHEINFPKVSISIRTRSRGRPKVQFAEASTTTKKRMLKDLQETTSPEKLLFAAKTVLRKQNKRSTINLLHECEKSPGRPMKLKRLIEKGKQSVIPYTPDEALAYMLDSDISRDVYIQTRLGAKKRNANIYPAYEKIREARKLCYPESIEISDEGAKISLQSLLDKTLTRLLEIIEIPHSVEEILLISKWGCDGSSGYTEFMHKPKAPTEDSDSDSDNEEDDHEKGDIEEEDDDYNIDEDDSALKNLFLISLVPLRLLGNPKSEEPIKLWENPHPSSTLWCRPIRMLYKKETTKETIKQINSLNIEINNLKPMKIGEVTCNYQLCLTMVNGKAISAITGIPVQTCHICGAKPTQMNLSEPMETDINIDNLKYGLTTMHAWMKCMELILHLGYYLELRRPTIRGADAIKRREIDERKNNIKKKLKERLGIHVDRIIQGRGTSNTGNVGRRFLKNYKEVSNITGVDETFIQRLYIIMIALSCGEQINFKKFDEFAANTLKLYVSLYNWYRLPVSVHKILLHGAKTIKALILPIGHMSEEAQESCNKLYKRLRERHSRKDKMQHVTEDVINGMLVLSDPKISSIRQLKKIYKKDKMPKEVIELVNYDESQDDDDDDDDD